MGKRELEYDLDGRDPQGYTPFETALLYVGICVVTAVVAAVGWVLF